MMLGRPAGSGASVGRGAAGRDPVARRMAARTLAAACSIALAAIPGTALAASNNVRITKLSDIAFGPLANLSTDAVQSESLCVYANTAARTYNVRAIGSGSGGAFTLASGSANMSFDVQWSASAGQSGGVQLSPNVALGGQLSAATQQTCNAGPAATASLIVILRSAALSSAPAGSYNGSLTLVIGAE